MKSRVLFLCLLGYGVSFIYLLLPYTNHLRNDLILFRSDIELSLESHVYYLCERLRMVIFFYIVLYLSQHYHKELTLFFWLSVGYLVDYLVWYNGHLFYAGPVPVSYTLIMGAVMSLTIIKCLIYD